MPALAGLSSDDSLLAEATAELETVADWHTFNNVKSRYLGRGGVLQKRLREIGRIPQEERAAAGAQANRTRAALEQLFERHKQVLAEALVARKLASEHIDVTLPGRQPGKGTTHPLHQTIARAVEIFSAIGFEVAEGPEVETDYYNFTALNQPEDHPARSMHDTFYVRGTPFLLRTHTSPVQIRYMEKHGNDRIIRAISPGRVYRCDHDATHSPMFHQIEGLWVDDCVRFTDLKGILGEFFRAFFGDEDIALRFRPSFFPFTEPSAECDIRRGGGDQWMEVAGCGMVHPAVLAAAGVDGENRQGFAFGMGVERLAMLYYGIDDIRSFFENDIRFLAQFE